MFKTALLKKNRVRFILLHYFPALANKTLGRNDNIEMTTFNFATNLQENRITGYKFYEFVCL